MFNEATTIGAPSVPMGLRWAFAAAAFLAVVAVFIAFNLPTAETAGVGEATVVDARLHDYGLRHPPQQLAASSVGADTRLHDYALRHLPSRLSSSSVAVTRLDDYALRHIPQQLAASFSNSPDYALRHLGD